MVDKKTTCRFSTRKMWIFLSLISFLCINIAASQVIEAGNENLSYETLYPTVMIATPVRNKAHTLPWFFGQLEKLNYPKDRLAIWIHSDYNTDDSIQIVQKWVNASENLYNSVEFTFSEKFTRTSKPGLVWDRVNGSGNLYNSVEFTFSEKFTTYPGEKGPCDWTDERFDHMIKLRQEAMKKARLIWADYLFMLDADVMLVNPDTLKILVEQKKPIIAPMLNSSVGQTYSNFWGGMNDEGYYKRVPEYFKVVERQMKGLFKVPMVHTAFLIDLNYKKSDKLSYIPPEGYDKARDDIILFAQSATNNDIPIYVINTAFYGYVMVPLDDFHNLDIEREQFMYLQVEDLDFENPHMGPGTDYIIEGRGLKKSPHLQTSFIPKDRLGFDQVYMINLDRRPERRKRMLHVFDILGIEAVRMPAVDGMLINDSFLQKLELNILPGFSDPVKGRLLNDTYLYKDLNIQVVPGFSDPYGGRPMTMGEIGCFLSHYFIWKDVVDKGYESVVIFEDDLRFEPYFRAKLANIMSTVRALKPDWDLIYLGRKRLSRKDEAYLEGTKQLVWPSYSYWTLSYLISNKGARKLLAQKPLQNLLPVDEYLPVMFDKHPEKSWKEPFYPRDLITLSADPLLIYPTHYLGEPNYISDTEYSEIIVDKDEKGNQHNTPEEPQGPPVSDFMGPKSGILGKGYDNEAPYQTDDAYNKDEL